MKTFWQHTNGLVYVVESDSFGTMTGAAGPLDIGNLRDPSEYPCGQGILTWVKRTIVERQLCRINPKIAKEPSPSPDTTRRTRDARSPSPPCQKVLTLKARRPPEPQPDDKQREIANRQKFGWSSTYHL